MPHIDEAAGPIVSAYRRGSDRGISEAIIDLAGKSASTTAPFPGAERVDAYIDTPDRGYGRIADPDLVVERVWAYARAASVFQAVACSGSLFFGQVKPTQTTAGSMGMRPGEGA